MPVSKDLTIATSILVTCCVLLVIVLTPPGTTDATTTTPSTPGALADGGRQPMAGPGSRQGGLPDSRDATTISANDLGGAPADLASGGPADPAPGGRDANPFDRGSDTLTPAATDGGTRIDPVDDLADGPSATGTNDGNPFERIDDPIDTAPTDTTTATPVATDPSPFDAAPTQLPAATNGGTRHVVQRGETLQSISFQHYNTHHRWQDIARANGVDPMALMPGDELTIPALQGVITEADHGTTRAAAGGSRSYVVQRGDSYYTIARDQLGDATRWQELQSLNNIDAYDLIPGTTISLPGGSSQPRTTAGARQRRDIPAGARTHTVRQGEYLSDIALEHLGRASRWRAIAEANNISDPTKVRVGDVLIIPATAGGSSAAPSSTGGGSSRPAASGNTHTIQRGETLQTISQQHFGTTRRWPDILRANPGINPERLMPGTVLNLPGASANGTSSSGTGSTRPAPRRETPTRPTTPAGNDLPELPDLDQPSGGSIWDM